MESDNFHNLDTDTPLPTGWNNKLTATIGNYAKVTFGITNHEGMHDQFVIAYITPLPDALVEFMPITTVLLPTESLDGNLNNPKAVISYLKYLREQLIDEGYMPSPAINVSYTNHENA